MAMQFRLLGAVEATVDGEPVRLGHAQLRCMLAVLLVEVNHLVTVDQLIDRVWAERRLPRQPRRAVQHNIPLLRRALAATPGVTLTRHGAGYQLSTDPDTIDLHRFRTLLDRAHTATHEHNDDHAAALLEQALALWRGEPFADLYTDTPWLHTQRTTLTACQHAARLDLTDIRLRQGRHAELLAELATQSTLHPVDERLAGQYLLTLYRCGRQADALHHYEQTRVRLAEELGTDPSPPLQELHQRILRGDPELVAPPAANRRDAEPVPHQLLSAPQSFVGRPDELATLTAALDHEADHSRIVQISALAGAGGIGKTWLTLHWAHTYRDHFPDGQLFVDLHGFSPANAPMQPPVAVRGFLDALGVAPARVPADPHTQAALYRSLVADKRMLIVLDNAADADQVIPLLPGSVTCTVVVTSRRHLATLITRYGARHLQLDILSHAEAHTLLTERLGQARVTAEPDAADELIRLCGRYPLALAIMTARAQTRPRIPLAEFTIELRDLGLDALDDDEPAASLPAVLSWSLRGLTVEQRTVFALLGIAPGPDIGLPAAASLTGLPARRTGTVLDTLEEASLLARQPCGRYAMHDLIRAYATTTAHHDLAEEVRVAALRRVLDFYTHTAHTAAQLLNPHRAAIRLAPPTPGASPHPLPNVPAAMAWFDTEHANLLAAQHTATTQTWHHAVWQLAWTLGTFHYRRGHRHDELAVWRAAVNAATHLPDPTPRIHAYKNLGSAYANLGCHEEATGHLHQALALAEHHHDLAEQANTHHLLAAASERRGDYRRALERTTRALGLFRALDQPVWEAHALNGVGWYAAHLGDYDTARAHCRAALALHRDHHNAEGEADTLDSLGYIDHHTGNHHQAIHHYQQALTQRRDLSNTYEAATTLDNLGHPHAALGQHDQARTVWREALELYRQQGRDEHADRVQRQLNELDNPGCGDGPDDR